jgi:hypothetical protein
MKSQTKYLCAILAFAIIVYPTKTLASAGEDDTSKRSPVSALPPKPEGVRQGSMMRLVEIANEKRRNIDRTGPLDDIIFISHTGKGNTYACATRRGTIFKKEFRD